MGQSRLLLFLFLHLLIPDVSAQARPRTTFKPYYPPDESIAKSFSCGMGAAEGCLPISRETLTSLDECSTSVTIAGPISDIGALLMNRYADTVFFQELANRSVAATECQVKILSGEKNVLVDSAWKIYHEAQPLIKKLVEMRDRPARERLQRLRSMSQSAQMGAAQGLANDVASDQPRVDKLNRAIDQLLSQVPFGSHDDVKTPLRALAEKDVTESEFAATMTGAYDKLNGTLQGAQRTFEGMRDHKTGQYDLSLSQYVELYASPGARDLAKKLDPSGKSLKCRFDSCFIDGPRNTQFATIVGLTGLSIITLGEASPLLLAASAVAPLAAGALNIQKTCFKEPFNASAYIQGQQCTAQALKETASSQLDKNKCAMNLIMTALDIPFSVSTVARLTSEARALGSLVRETGGVKVYKNSEGVETSISVSGRREYLYPDSNVRIVEENAVRTTRWPDGRREVEENGIKSSYDARGRLESRQNADGTIEGQEIVVTAKRARTREIASPEQREKSLKALEDYLEANKSVSSHKIFKFNGEVTLKIGFLQRESTELSRLLYRAISSGAITHIDAGEIVGPKVFNLLTRLQDMAPTTRPLFVKGQMDFDELYRTRQAAVAVRGTSLNTPEAWSAQEIADFDHAIDRLGIPAACKKFYGGELSSCKGIQFSMDGRNPAGIEWRAIGVPENPRGRIIPDNPDQ